MAKISIEQAEQELFDLLYAEDIEDRLYDLAKDLFDKSVRKIEDEHTIENPDVLDRDEEWYDSSFEEFMRQAFGRMIDFLTANV